MNLNSSSFTFSFSFSWKYCLGYLFAFRVWILIFVVEGLLKANVFSSFFNWAWGLRMSSLSSEYLSLKNLVSD